MVNWLSVTQLSKTLEIPETTTRRYLNNFEEYFRWEQIGRGKKYHSNSVEILKRIAMLYSLDRDTAEIKRILSDEYAFTIETDNIDPTIQPPAYDVSGKLDEFQEKQTEFNKQLLKQLQEQQKYITKLIENRDDDIKQAKLLVSPEKKKTERFEQIMAEHKVKKKLEKESLNLWMEKPDEERTEKVGWFRKKENFDKRNEFIKNYIDEHFEEKLKKEMNL